MVGIKNQDMLLTFELGVEHQHISGLFYIQKGWMNFYVAEFIQ
jgi:hypothetical protein